MIEIEDLDEREEAARLLNAYRDACETYYAHERDMPPLTEAQRHALDELAQKYRADKAAILSGGASLVDLKQAEDDALQAYDDNPLALMEDDEGRPLRCAVSNVPIVDDDEIVEDPETGEVFLRSAAGLPPRQDVVYEDEEEAA